MAPLKPTTSCSKILATLENLSTSLNNPGAMFLLCVSACVVAYLIILRARTPSSRPIEIADTGTHGACTHSPYDMTQGIGWKEQKDRTETPSDDEEAQYHHEKIVTPTLSGNPITLNEVVSARQSPFGIEKFGDIYNDKVMMAFEAWFGGAEKAVKQ